MKEYRVDKVFSSDKKKDGTDLGFMKYSVKVGEDWFELKGYGKEKVKEGDTITAERVDTKGKGAWADKVFTHLELPKPEMVTKDEFEALESRVRVLEEALFNGGEPDREPEPEVDVSDIPF